MSRFDLIKSSVKSPVAVAALKRLAAGQITAKDIQLVSSGISCGYFSSDGTFTCHGCPLYSPFIVNQDGVFESKNCLLSYTPEQHEQSVLLPGSAEFVLRCIQALSNLEVNSAPGS